MTIYNRTITVQRTKTGMLLGACIALSADDLTFVDSETEEIEIVTRQVKDGLIIEVKKVIG